MPGRYTRTRQWGQGVGKRLREAGCARGAQRASAVRMTCAHDTAIARVWLCGAIKSDAGPFAYP